MRQTAMAAATASRGLRCDTSRVAGAFLFILIYYTNVYFRFTQCVETGMAALASALGSRDTTRLEPLVSLFFVFYFIFFTLMLF